MSTPSSRVKWQCPGCGKRFVVPSSNGLKLCPECSKSPIPSPGVESRSEPEIGQTDIPDLASVFPSIMDVPLVTASKERRYPRLRSYLDLLAVFAKIQLIIAILAALILIVVLLNSGLIPVLEKELPIRGISGIVMLGMALSVLAITVPALLSFFLAMTVVEFFRVTLDIESNTRNSEKHLSFFRGQKVD